MRLPDVCRLHTVVSMRNSDLSGRRTPLWFKDFSYLGPFYDDFVQEEMLVELQSSVRKEEDTFVKKIRDLETRLEQYEDNGAGDSSAQV